MPEPKHAFINSNHTLTRNKTHYTYNTFTVKQNPHRINGALDGRVGVGWRLRHSVESINLVGVFDKLLPRNYGGLSRSELHSEHFPVPRF